MSILALFQIFNKAMKYWFGRNGVQTLSFEVMQLRADIRILNAENVVFDLSLAK